MDKIYKEFLKTPIYQNWENKNNMDIIYSQVMFEAFMNFFKMKTGRKLITDAKVNDENIKDKESANVRKAIEILEGSIATSEGYELKPDKMLLGYSKIPHPISKLVYNRLVELGYGKGSKGNNVNVIKTDMTFRELLDYSYPYKVEVVQTNERGKYKIYGNEAQRLINSLKSDGYLKDSISDSQPQKIFKVNDKFIVAKDRYEAIRKYKNEQRNNR